MGEPIAGLAGMARELLVVSSRVEEKMEAAGLEHLLFRTMRLMNEASNQVVPWPNAAGRYSMLTSDLVLPFADRTNLRDARGNPYIGDTQAGCHILSNWSDGEYEPPELRYRRQDVEKVPPFGLAVTNEQFRPGRRLLVASKKFYEFCRSQHLKMDWIPVRVID